MKKSVVILLSMAIVPSLAIAASKDAIISRQAHFKGMGKANKAIGDELKKVAPSLAVIRPYARTLVSSSKAVVPLFPRGTGQDSGVKTGALPTIWTKSREFKIASGKLILAANALEFAAASGNMDKIRQAAAGVGPTCKGCHDQFRGKD